MRFRDVGVVGYDIAGAEVNFPPTLHLDTFNYLHRHSVPIAIHAGEAAGLRSIPEATQ